LRDLDQQATCIAAHAGRPISRLALLWRFLELLEVRYATLLAGVSPSAEWASRLTILGRRVQVAFEGHTVEGIAVGADAEGALIVEDAAGARRVILAGDLALQ